MTSWTDGGSTIKTILILSAHQDDECLQTAGVIRSAVLAGDRVFACFATNGEYEAECDAAVRAEESRLVLQKLGVSPERIWFLGYADTGMPYADSFLQRLYRGSNPLVPSRWGRRETWTPDGSDYRYLRSGVHGAYTAGSFRRDLYEVLAQTLPDEIYTTAPGDRHGDHDALGRFTAEAAAALAGAEAGWKPKLCYYLIHADETNAWPDRRAEAFCEPGGLDETPLGRCRAEHRPLPIGFSSGDKRALIDLYRSQKPEAYGGYLTAFAKREELLFWQA